MPMPQVAEQSVLVDVEPVSAAPKTPVDKTFRSYVQDQPMLLPPDLRDWLPAGHPARMVDDLVEHGLDLGGVYAGYTEVRGAPPYDSPSRILARVPQTAQGMSPDEIATNGQGLHDVHRGL